MSRNATNEERVVLAYANAYERDAYFVGLLRESRPRSEVTQLPFSLSV
jgi:hypothetical protein